MFERFTDRARKVMALANQEAPAAQPRVHRHGAHSGRPAEGGTGVAASVLKNMGVGLDKARQEVERLIKSGPEAVIAAKLPQTPRAKRVIEYAIEESRKLGHNYVGTEHLLLACRASRMA